MKKLFTLMLLALFMSCEQDLTSDQKSRGWAEVQEFLNSPDYASNECFFADYGTIGPGTVTDGILQIPVGINILQVMKTETGYFMNLFTVSNNTGRIINVNTKAEFFNCTIDSNMVKSFSFPEMNIETKGFFKEFMACFRQTMDWLHDNSDTMYFICSFSNAVCASVSTGACTAYVLQTTK